MNAEDPAITFKGYMAKLNRAERRRAIKSVRDVIRAASFDDAADSAYGVECCPCCGSAAVVKKGKAGNGEQRYLCLGCGGTFGMGSGRILGRAGSRGRPVWPTPSASCSCCPCASARGVAASASRPPTPCAAG